MTSTDPSELMTRLQSLDADITLWGPQELAGRDPGENPKNFNGGLLAMPADTAAAVALVNWCRAEGVGIVPQGGRTGLVGGNISQRGEVILSTARMNGIERLDVAERTAVVGAGVTLQALQEAAAVHGLTTGIDLPSRGTATIGGMVSTNAGGILAFRNGVMRHQVLGLEAVMASGQVFSDLSRVVKVSAGPDLKHLFIGAEGALGIVTRVVVKLESTRPARATALLGVPNAQAALAIIGYFQALPAVMLEGAEMMWDHFIRDSARTYEFDLGWLDDGAAGVLLIEVSAETVTIATEALETGLEALWDTVGIHGGLVAQSLDQARRFWQLREESHFMYAYHADGPSFDVSVPPSYLDTYVAGLGKKLTAVNSRYDAYVFGHIADGNLHLSIMHTGPVADDEMLRIEEAVYSGVEAAGGSFSAEHGVGLNKRHAYLTFGNPEKRVMAQQIKALFDPDRLFNRGKVPF